MATILVFFTLVFMGCIIIQLGCSGLDTVYKNSVSLGKMSFNKIKDGNQRLHVLITALSPLKMINICSNFLAFAFDYTTFSFFPLHLVFSVEEIKKI